MVGVELEKTVPGDTAAQYLGAAAWTGHEGAGRQVHVAAHVRPRSPTSTTARYGLDESHLHAIAQLNFANATRQPQRADPRLDACPTWSQAAPTATTTVNPVVEGRIRRFDCSQMTDGGAGVVLVTDDYLRDHPDAQPDRPDRRLGPPHRRPRPAAEARPRPPTTRT